MGPAELIVCLLIAVLVVASYRLADSKGYNPWLWSLVAFFIGPLVLLGLLVAPSRSGRGTPIL